MESRQYVKRSPFPEVVSQEYLGPVVDESQTQPSLSRDIGRSSELGGEAYFFFGDTFPSGKPCINNTLAAVYHKGFPRNTCYEDIDADKGAEIRPFIPYTQEEKDFNDLYPNQEKRVTLWTWGGFVDEAENSLKGFIWYAKGVADKEKGDSAVGTGIARVFYDQQKRTLQCTREHDTLWDLSEPSWGTFSTIRIGNLVYMFGHHENNVLLACCPINLVLEKKAYWVWNGAKYDPEWKKAYPIMSNMQHGQFFLSHMFSRPKFVFIGCSSYGDSKIQMGISDKIEGPYDIRAIAAAGFDNRPVSNFTYCVYPHPWAFDEKKGELMVSWSEPWPGEVICCKLQFKMEDYSPSDLEATELESPELIENKS